MQLLPNTTSQRQLTFLQFTCSPGSQLQRKRISVKGKVRQEKKQWADEEEEDCTGKGRPQFCVFWVLPQLYLVQQNTSHIKGRYLDWWGRLSRGKKVSDWTCLLAMKFYCYQVGFGYGYQNYPFFIYSLPVVTWQPDNDKFRRYTQLTKQSSI